MIGAPVYNDRVRRLFAKPDHAGDASGVRVALSRGADKVVLSASLDGTRVSELRFRVYGCPHLIAAAESFCDGFEGREALDMQEFQASNLLEKLEIPVEKTGRILLLEDAIRALLAAIEAQTA